MTTATTSTDAIRITPARADDLDALLALEQGGFPAAERWSRRSWQGELVGEGRRVLVARSHQVVGVVTLQLTGRTFAPLPDDPDLEIGPPLVTADLHRLVVAPLSRRHGVGSALVTAGVEAVRHAGARSIMLEVRYDNEAAIALYARLGFEQLAVRRDYYGPGADAMIMKRYDLQEAR